LREGANEPTARGREPPRRAAPAAVGGFIRALASRQAGATGHSRFDELGEAIKQFGEQQALQICL
jgi:hypothetical protein